MSTKVEYLVRHLKRGRTVVALKTTNYGRASALLDVLIRYDITAAWIDVLWDGRPIEEMTIEELTEAEMVGFSEYEEMAPRTGDK